MHSQSKQTLGSVNRALDVLEAFSDDRPRWGLSELARELNADKGTLHRLLRNLQQRGYIRQDPETRLYRLGFMPLRIAQAALVGTPSEAAVPHLRSAARQLGDQMTLWVLDGSEAVCVANVPGTQPLRAHTNLGARQPAILLASGRCLLAFGEPDALRAQLGSAYDEIAEDLEKVRQEGVVVSNLRWPEVLAVSAPVRDHRSRVVAAISLSGPTSRLRDERLDEARRAVLEAANATSRALGYDATATVFGEQEADGPAP